jgi:hypothetical protein
VSGTYERGDHTARERRACGASFVRSACALTAFLAAASLSAAITVDGVADKGVYADRVDFRVLGETNADYTAALNGASVPIDVVRAVTEADYYELLVTRRPRNHGDPETARIRFIVRASARGNTEWGLPPWMPYPQIPSAAAECAGSTLSVIAPVAYVRDLPIPIVALVRDASGRRTGVNGQVTFGQVRAAAVRLLRGVGSGSLPAASPGDFACAAKFRTLGARVLTRIEAETAWQIVSGTIAEATDWGEDARIRIDADLTIAAGATLAIGARSIVLLAPGVAVAVEGALIVGGTPEQPVVFAARERGRPWGGLRLEKETSRAELRGTIMTESGADSSWFDTHAGYIGVHRKEEALLLLTNGAHASLADCYLFDGGQAGHSERAYLTMTRCLVQRFTTGGQYNWGLVSFQGCAFVEFPSADAPFADGDNDGLYFTGGAHTLADCLVGWSVDDGLDAGGGDAPVEVTGCWFEACPHEGLALSTLNRRTVSDTVVLDCGQGIECGFGSLQVDAARCFFTANAVGARFGDNYSTAEWTYDGFLAVRDSLVLHNGHDIWGMAWDTWEEHPAQMDVAGNFLTAADPLHPDNLVWRPGVDAARLLPFMPVPEGPVGVGLALRAEVVPIADVARGLYVRLSAFTTRTVTVDYALRRAGAAIAAGTLEFPPGASLVKIPCDLGALAGNDVVEASLADPVNAEVTGIGRAYFTYPIALVPGHAEWRYSDGGVDQGTAWRMPGFNDGAWKRGTAELGFGDGDEATVLGGGPSGGRYPTIYFRRTFEAPDPASLASLSLALKRDDGAVVYVNGSEVVRSNMPEGAIAYGTWSASGVSGSDESLYVAAELAPSALRAGANTIAVEVHQSDDGSSDLSFDLALTAAPRVVPRGKFVRGDANGDGALDLSDAVRTLRTLFAGAATDCADALDANDSGSLDIADAVFVLAHLFASGADLPLPFPSAGCDATTDGLGCAR